MTLKRRQVKKTEYDVCLSFAGEDRRYVEDVASHLRSKGLRVFYDEYERIALWGKNLYEHLDDVYRNAAKHCVVFISKYYAHKLWTNHERKSAQARAFAENYEYILPARFDGTALPGLLPTVGYIELEGLSPRQFAGLIVQKVGVPNREYYVPPVPDRLFEQLKVKSDRRRAHVVKQAESFVQALKRMSNTEKILVADVFTHGCPTDLPENMHIKADLLRRITGLPASKCIRELKRLGSLGFQTKVSRNRDHGSDPTIELSFHVNSVAYDGPREATGTVDEMIDCLGDVYCDDCMLKAFLKGDFSSLSTATIKPERHPEQKRASRKPAKRQTKKKPTSTS